MTKQNTESCLSLAILGFLSIEPAPATDCGKYPEHAARGYSASPGAIYPALQRLEAEGFIEGTVEKRDTLRPRMVYSLTGRGKEELIETLRRPVVREDVIQRTDELLLRFAFMSGLVDTSGIIEFLRAMAEEMEGYLEVLEGEFEKRASSLPPTGRAALEQGVEIYRTIARWAGRTLEEFEKNARSKGDDK